MSIFKSLMSKKSKAAKISLAVGSIAAVAAISVLVTSAYLSARTDVKRNEFAPRETVVKTYTDTQINEDGGTDYLIQNNGHISGKNVYVENPADTSLNKKPVFVRIRAVVSGPAGSDTLVNAKISDSQTLNENWFKDGDYYYYKYVLYPDCKTQPVFNGDLVIDFSGSSVAQDITVTFITDTVQAWENGEKTVNTDKVIAAWGSLPSKVITTNGKDQNVSLS